MLEPSTQVHGKEGHQHADRQGDDRHQRRAHMQQEHEAHERHDDAFFEQRVDKRVDGSVDERRAVVDRLDTHALGQAAGDLLHASSRCRSRRARSAEALQNDPAHHLALAVELGRRPALVRPELDPCHVPQEHGHAAIDLENDLFCRSPMLLR